MFEIKVEANININHHGGTDELCRKLDQIASDVKKLVESASSLNYKERALLQRLVDDLNALAKD